MRNQEADYERTGSGEAFLLGIRAMDAAIFPGSPSHNPQRTPLMLQLDPTTRRPVPPLCPKSLWKLSEPVTSCPLPSLGSLYGASPQMQGCPGSLMQALGSLVVGATGLGPASS